jgi:hypothetical protein
MRSENEFERGVGRKVFKSLLYDGTNFHLLAASLFNSGENCRSRPLDQPTGHGRTPPKATFIIVYDIREHFFVSIPRRLK